ncbi:MAG: DUF6446 family protein [Pseudomonadota bacterium]
MNWTRAAIVFILGSGVLAGVGMLYLQNYAGWAELTSAEVGEIQLQTLETGELQAITAENVKGLDTVTDGVRLSGDLSFRACFDTPVPLSVFQETYVVMDDPVPLTSPGWFDCYDARGVGKALEDGLARAFRGKENIAYGVDRVVAIYPNGLGFVWHQLNECGEAVFAGDPVPEDCPEPPVRGGE